MNNTNNSTKCIDHLGNQFDSVNAMCQYWNIPVTTFKKRINKPNTSIKDALTKEKNKKSTAIKCVDHLGNEFDSIKQMCEYHNISQRTYINRINSGLTMEKALTKTLKYKLQITDHVGNKFDSINSMCKYYNIHERTFKSRTKEYNWTLEKALTTIPIPITINELSVLELLENSFYKISFNNEIDIWSHAEIMEYYRTLYKVKKPINEN